MITIWNRRELLSTFSQEDYAHAADRLRTARIPYSSRVVHQEAASGWGAGRRGLYGSLGMNPASTRQYILYVRRQDFEEAAAALQKG